MIKGKFDYLCELIVRSAITTALPILMLVVSSSLSRFTDLIKLATISIISYILVLLFNAVIDLTIRYKL